MLICYSQTIRRATNCKPQQPYYPRPDGGVRGSTEWKMHLAHHSALGPLLCEEDMVTIQKQHSVWVPGVGLPIDPHGTSASEPHLLSRGNRINCLISYLPTITIDINTSDSKGFCCIISGKRKLWFLTLHYLVPSPKSHSEHPWTNVKLSSVVVTIVTEVLLGETTTEFQVPVCNSQTSPLSC